MRVTGTDINQFDVFRFTNKPKTTPALKWELLSNGNYVAVDRGADNDIYESELSFYGAQTEIDNIIDELEANRAGGTNYFTLSQFNGVDDQIFGADIDYSGTLDVTVTKWGKRKQKEWLVFTWSCTVQLIEDPYLYTGTPSFPAFKPIIGYRADSTWTVKKMDTYDNTFTYIDHNKDTGIFEGTVILNNTDMNGFRRYLLSTIRGGDMTVSSIAGLSELFGSKRGSIPSNVKVLEFRDEMININFWHVKLKLAEIV
jgi:hypothetical protein